jgi:hypothetical protein
MLHLLMVVLAGGAIPLHAEQVVVTGVAGQVLFRAGTEPGRAVTAGLRLGAGTFSAAANGILYLSTYEGSELRLGESGTLRYDGMEDRCPLEKPSGLRSTFHLLAGKLEVTIKVPTQPPHCYRIILPRAQASVSRGQCVMCMHGQDTFIYVARGQTIVTGGNPPEPIPAVQVGPLFGAVPGAGQGLAALAPAGGSQILIGSGRVGTIDVDGRLGNQPLSAVTASTQTCLLAGFNPDVAAGSGKKSGFSPDASIVSPTQ